MRYPRQQVCGVSDNCWALYSIIFWVGFNGERLRRALLEALIRLGSVVLCLNAYSVRPSVAGYTDFDVVGVLPFRLLCFF